MTNIGVKKLRKIQESRSLTQADLAKMAGITQGGISHYMTGRRRKVDPFVALKLSEAFPEIMMQDFYTPMKT